MVKRCRELSLERINLVREGDECAMIAMCDPTAFSDKVGKAPSKDKLCREAEKLGLT